MGNMEIKTQKKKKKINETLRVANEKSHQFTCECICTAMIYLMANHRIEDITITAIIERSGVSRAAFYRNFSSKNDVLKYIIDHLWQELKIAFSDPLLRENPRLWIINYFKSQDTDTRAIKLLAQTGFPLHHFISDEIQQEMKNALSRKEYYRQHSILIALWDILIEWCRFGMQETPEEMADIILHSVVL